MATYAFLSSPPQSNYPAQVSAPPTPPKNKTKHKPHPITTTPQRCLPPRARSSSHSRKRSISGGYSPSLVALTPNTPTPKTPHLTNHGYNIAFATYARSPKSPKRSPSSPKRHPGSPRRSPGSPKRSPSSPKRTSPRRRNHPSSVFAPPSPTKPKLSKIRSLTNLRSRPTPSPIPVRPITPGLTSTFTSKDQTKATKAKSTPIMTTTTSTKPSSKRAKRSATPARGSSAYAQYRPLPFIQQMHMIQFLEGGTMESIIRRHHTQEEREGDGPMHGYAFMDERGMIWFDEEEEWEFACLLPKREVRKRGGMKRLWGKRTEGEEWEEFGDDEEVEESGEEEIEEDDIMDDLAAFGGMGRDAKGPVQSVLKLPKERKRRGERVVKSTPTPGSKFARKLSQNSLKQEFLASSFAPPPVPVVPPPKSTSSYRNMFKRKGAASTTTNTRSTKDTGATTHVDAGSKLITSFTSVSSLRGGDVLDGRVRSSTEPFVRSSTSMESYTRSTTSLAASNASTRSAASNSSTSLLAHSRAASASPNTRTVSPPPAAARRLGIDPAVAVAVYSSRSAAGKKNGKK